MKSTLIAATLATVFAIQPVLAGGPVATSDELPVAVEVLPADWSGLHFGLAAARPNGGNARAERSMGAVSAQGDWSGTLPFLSLGYDWQRGKLVYGVTLAMSGGELAATPTTAGFFRCPGCETVADKLTTLTGRVGLATGKTLFYAKAGSAQSYVIATVAGFPTSGEGTVSGWTAGLGVERYVGSNITLSAEYSEFDLGRLELPMSCGSECYSDISFGLLQLGVNYRW